MTETIGIVGQVTGNYKTFEEFDGDFDIKIHTFMVGLRASSPGRVRGFGQFLVGGTNVKGTENTTGLSESETDFSIQFGGGVNVMGSGNIGIRAGVDYLRLMAKDDGLILQGEDINGIRFNVGVVIGF